MGFTHGNPVTKHILMYIKHVIVSEHMTLCRLQPTIQNHGRLNFLSHQWRSHRGQRGHAPQLRTKIWMVWNGGPITGRLIHRVTKYSGFQNACVRFSFPVLPFRKKTIHNSNRIKLEMFYFCRRLQHKS